MNLTGKTRLSLLMTITFLALTGFSCGKPSEDIAAPKARPFRLGLEDRKLIREKTAKITEPVTVNFYSGKQGEKHSAEARALLNLMSTMTSKIRVNELGLSEQVIREEFETDHGPVMVPEGAIPIGISYYGYPEELELEPFLDSFLIATGQMEPLADTTASYLKSLESDVMIRVFVTPL